MYPKTVYSLQSITNSCACVSSAQPAFRDSHGSAGPVRRRLSQATVFQSTQRNTRPPAAPVRPAQTGLRDLRGPHSSRPGAGRRPGLGARLPATSDEAWAGWYIADYSTFLFSTQITVYQLGFEAILGGAQRLLGKGTLHFDSAIERSSGFCRSPPPLLTFRVRYTRAL